MLGGLAGAAGLTDVWTIERLVPGGDGFCRAPDGRAAFVAGGLPGDRIRPTDVEEKKRMVRVRAFELVEPGPDRLTEAPCEVAGRCGGCDWMFLAREAQLRWKRELVADALRRIGKLGDVDVAEVVTAGPDLGYRTRLGLHRRKGRLGLFERGSHRVVEIERCAVAVEPVNQAISVLRQASLGDATEVEVRAAPRGPTVVVRTDPPEAAASLGGLLPAALPDEPAPVQTWELPLDLELSVPATSFVQVNPWVNYVLVDALTRGAVERDAASFLDLYCGAGNFALALAGVGLTGSGIEGDAGAVEAARANAERQFLTSRVGFLHGPVAALLPRIGATAGAVDLVVLDPPRSGARDVIDGVLGVGPRWIAAVSCDPATLSRDLAALVAGGYELESVTPFDMFPHTHHVEVLAWLRAR